MRDLLCCEVVDLLFFKDIDKCWQIFSGSPVTVLELLSIIEDTVAVFKVECY